MSIKKVKKTQIEYGTIHRENGSELVVTVDHNTIYLRKIEGRGISNLELTLAAAKAVVDVLKDAVEELETEKEFGA